MFLELIAIFIAGIAGAGMMMLLNLTTGGRLPKSFMPIAAGAAMLIAGISSEYSWYSRTAGNLPEGIIVAQAVENKALWRPWTYVFPMTDRFVAVDVGNMVANTKTPGLYLAKTYIFGRWRAKQLVEVMADCNTNRRAAPGLDNASDPVWRDVGPDDAIVKTICNGG